MFKKIINKIKTTNKEDLKRTFAEKVLKPMWIVNKSGELGIRILGINMWYYKWPDPTVCLSSDDSGFWRYAEKREFGEVIHSQLQKVKNK